MRRRRVVRPAVAGAVPVAVARDSAVLVSRISPVLEVEFQRDLSGLQKNGGRTGAVGLLSLAKASQVDLVLVAIDEVALAVHLEACIASTQDQGGGHKDGDHNVDGQNDSSCEHSEPLAQSTTRFGTASQTLLFLALAPCNYPVGNDAVGGDECSPDDAGNTRRALFSADARDADNDDQVDEEEQG